MFWVHKWHSWMFISCIKNHCWEESFWVIYACQNKWEFYIIMSINFNQWLYNFITWIMILYMYIYIPNAYCMLFENKCAFWIYNYHGENIDVNEHHLLQMSITNIIQISSEFNFHVILQKEMIWFPSWKTLKSYWWMRTICQCLWCLSSGNWTFF